MYHWAATIGIEAFLCFVIWHTVCRQIPTQEFWTFFLCVEIRLRRLLGTLNVITPKTVKPSSHLCTFLQRFLLANNSNSNYWLFVWGNQDDPYFWVGPHKIYHPHSTLHCQGFLRFNWFAYQLTFFALRMK